MKIALKIIKGIVTLFLLIVLLLVIFQKFTNNKIALGNIYVFQVASESMLPEYKIGDIIVSKRVEASKLKVGDDVTYYGVNGDMAGLVITHRIVDIKKENNEYKFTTKGIANKYEDPEITQNDIYGKVIYHTIFFSFVGRLMTNIIIYYALFVSVGVAFSYELITSFFVKKKDEDEE